MHLSLGGLQIALCTESARINRGWTTLLAGQIAPAGERPATLALHLEERSSLPALPAGTPLFSDEQGVVDVYAPAGETFVLHYRDGALITVSPAANRAEGIVTGAALNEGRLEDITYTSLAPLLRRQNRYLVHAFAASRHGRALLLVGPSGSGKTTTGLSLILAGWQLLANDVVLLHRREAGIVAYPTPGALTVRPPSLALLPALRRRPSQHDPRLDVYTYTGADLAGHRALPAAAPVRALCFPAITGERESSLVPQPEAVTLAQLMEESVDRWDRGALSAHLALLQALSSQAAGYRLHLGQAVSALPALLAPLLSD